MGLRCNWQLIDPAIGTLFYVGRTTKSFAHDLVNHAMETVIGARFIPSIGALLWSMKKKEAEAAEAWLQRRAVPICNPTLGRGKWAWREPDAAVPLSDFDMLPAATGLYAWILCPSLPAETWITDLLFDPIHIEQRKSHRNSLVQVPHSSLKAATQPQPAPPPPPKPPEAFHRYTVWAKQGIESGKEIAESISKIVVGPDVLQVANNTVVMLLTDKAAATVKRLWPWWGVEMDKEFSPITKEPKTIVTQLITELYRSLDERRPKFSAPTVTPGPQSPRTPVVMTPIAATSSQPPPPTQPVSGLPADWESRWKD